MSEARPPISPDLNSASQAAFWLEYEGPVLAGGVMDAQDVGAALVGVTRLIERANLLVNADRATVSVKVRGEFRAGSFDIALEVLQTFAGQASLLTEEQVKDVPYLLAILGLGDAGRVARIGMGVIKVLKVIKDQIFTVSPGPQPNTLTVSAGGDAHVTNHQTFIIVQDPEARQAINGLIQPIQRPGVEALRVKQQGQVVEEVRKGEIPPLPPTTPEAARELPVEEREAHVEVVKPAFRENMAWEFSEGGGASFPAMVTDENFLARVQHRIREFGKGDVLKVRLRTEKIQTLQGLRTENTVIEVLAELPPPTPLIPREDTEGVKPTRVAKPRTRRRKPPGRRGSR